MTTSADDPKKTRLAEPTRVFTPARIVALVLIAISVLGLAYLRFRAEAGSVSVPSGAKAGALILEPGSYATEKGTDKADVGTLVVSENRADPDSRLIALPVIRIRARSDHPAEPIFRLQGGPGLSNMDFPEASRLADQHDVVLVGYRGVDGSSVLDAPEVVSALKHSADLLSDGSMRAYAEAFKSAAERLRTKGVDLAGYTLSERVDDLEAARVALGYGRIDLLSESVGTRTAMIYSWRYPQSIHRSVMIGVNPPGHSTDFWTYQPEASTRLIDTFFGSGKVDDSLYTHRAMDFTPDVTFTALAKGIAGTMVGLAVVAVISQLWMARRVRRRGGFGRKTSAALRSVYPLVLGLGGWFLGALVVLTTLPAVPLDSEVLAVLSVGAPIGLGIYWAWVHRDVPAQSKVLGLSLAAGGALVGAWLGFNVTEGLMALVTTIVGAAVGANLTLIVFDITRERSNRTRLAANRTHLAASGPGAPLLPLPVGQTAPAYRGNAACEPGGPQF